MIASGQLQQLNKCESGHRHTAGERVRRPYSRAQIVNRSGGPVEPHLAGVAALGRQSRAGDTHAPERDPIAVRFLARSLAERADRNEIGARHQALGIGARECLASRGARFEIG
jgi:hypothetical protein